jgi:methylglutaconyl-CoA hydratase
MFGLLVDALESLKSRTDVRVIVLTGSGKYFCTGMDLGASNQKDMQGKAKTGATDVATVFEVMRNYPKPIVARINGPALGGGWGILFSTDVR